MALAIAAVLATAGLFELAGRAFLARRPTYAVLYLEPDPVLGWKQVPDFRYRWTGFEPYVPEFDVDIQTNSWGFRDRERALTKATGTVRVALLGDSLVEALQVPFASTAGQLLERQLSRGSSRYEVLNFGISNYSVGQYLLLWESYAERFAPDYVFAFVTPLQLDRTQRATSRGYFGAYTLELRPVFDVVEGELVRRPARDYERFVQAQQEVIERELGGQRSRARSRSPLGWIWQRWQPSQPVGPSPPPGESGSSWLVNSLVLEELARAVAGAGARFAVVDASLPSPRGTSKKLEELCARNQIGYLPLYRALVRAWEAGRATRWRGDPHFNEYGNELFAREMFEWLQREGTLPAR